MGRKKAVTTTVNEAESSPAQDTSFNTEEFDAAPQADPAIQASEIVHGLAEATRLPDETPLTRHASAVERKPIPRPADPFNIALDVLAGVRLSESRRYGKMLIASQEKPSPEVTAVLRDANFRYEPMEKMWALGLGDRPMSVRITADETFTFANGTPIAETREDLELARSQLADYEQRLGRVFAHAGYMDELAGLRDRLKVSLSGTPAEGEPTAAELADRIKAIRASHQVEAAPARVKARPRAESVGRREEVKEEPVIEPERPVEPPPEDDKPDDCPPPGSFRQRVRARSVQRGLF